MRRIWHIEKFYNDGSVERVKIKGYMYSKAEKSRAIEECKKLFSDEKVSAIYAYHVFLFFKEKGFYNLSHSLYLNRAGLIF